MTDPFAGLPKPWPESSSRVMTDPLVDLPKPSVEGKLDLGQVLRRTLSVWGALLGPCALLALLIHGPFVIARLVLPGPATLRAQGSGWALGVMAVYILERAMPAFVTAALAYRVLRCLHGRVLEPGRSAYVGGRNLLPLLGAGLLSSLLLPLGFCCYFVMPPLAATAAACYVVVPCIVLERIGIRAALRRCQALTAGCHGDILTAFAAAIAFRALCRSGATSLSPLLSQSLDSARPMALGIEGALALVAVLLESIATVAPIVVYNELRMNREGADLERLAQVFD